MEQNSPWKNVRLDLMQLHVPGWKDATHDDLEIKVLFGMTNKIYAITNKNPDKENLKSARSVIYRCFGKLEVPLFNRKVENHFMTVLSEANLAPKVYYSDEETRLEEFIEGKDIQEEQKSQSELFVFLAWYLANFHQQFKSEKVVFEAKPKWLPRMLVEDRFLLDSVEQIKSFRDRNLEKMTEAFLSQFGNDKEQTFLAKSLEKISKEDVNNVICHNDIHWGNIMYIPTEAKFVVFDFEYLHPNPRMWEIANFFTELTYAYGLSEYPFFRCDLTRFPDDKFVSEFLTYYLFFTKFGHEMYLHEARSQNYEEFIEVAATRCNLEDITSEVESLKKELFILGMFVNYFWILVFIMINNENELDNISVEDYMNSRIECYKFYKARVLEKEPDLKHI
eukprot:TRINITY_DN8845_c0_g3_i1.p1 TRINITY_DN8845_c0_g3~~TRINITY_DN8845_c0_g3_i1.p1  ORF type:complete len:393 (+),score=95.70 TRINITY_DN8845_c0_g3_i1:122-1300(+)